MNPRSSRRVGLGDAGVARGTAPEVKTDLALIPPPPPTRPPHPKGWRAMAGGQRLGQRARAPA